MSERFELSFKNKEVRMWFYVVLPSFIIGILFLCIGGIAYDYILWLLVISAWITFYIWRFFIEKSKKNNPS